MRPSDELVATGLQKKSRISNQSQTSTIYRYHIVAHSHGGNVVLHALRSLTKDPKKLGAVIFLGTPVLCFSRLPSWLNRSGLAMLLYGTGFVLSIVAAWLGGESLSSVRPAAARSASRAAFAASSRASSARIFAPMIRPA